MDTNTLLAAILFSAIGTGYLIYGKKQRNGIALLSGLVLCIMPYIVSSILPLVLICIALMALPFLVRH